MRQLGPSTGEGVFERGARRIQYRPGDDGITYYLPLTTVAVPCLPEFYPKHSLWEIGVERRKRQLVRFKDAGPLLNDFELVQVRLRLIITASGPHF